MQTDIVYLLENESMPGLYKIGKSTLSGLKTRLMGLSGTSGVPTPFKVLYTVAAANGYTLERQLHKEFHEYRVNDGREFFKCDKELLLKRFQEIDIDITPIDVNNYKPLKKGVNLKYPTVATKVEDMQLAYLRFLMLQNMMFNSACAFDGIRYEELFVDYGCFDRIDFSVFKWIMVSYLDKETSARLKVSGRKSLMSPLVLNFNLYDNSIAYIRPNLYSSWDAEYLEDQDVTYITIHKNEEIHELFRKKCNCPIDR